MMTLIATLLAMLIVAFTVYLQMARKQRELAIAKALGVANIRLYGAALCQTLAVSLSGFALAVLIAYTLLPLLPGILPQITLAVRAEDLLSVAVTVLPVALLASLGPVTTVARTDPLTVCQR